MDLASGVFDAAMLLDKDSSLSVSESTIVLNQYIDYLTEGYGVGHVDRYQLDNLVL